MSRNHFEQNQVLFYGHFQSGKFTLKNIFREILLKYYIENYLKTNILNQKRLL